MFYIFQGDFTKIERLRDALSFPLTYTFLVRQCLPVLSAQMAWNTEEWRRVQDCQLATWESTVLQIEERFSQSERDPSPVSPADVVASEEGFRVACSQSDTYRHFAVETLLRRSSGLIALLEQRRGEFSEAQGRWLSTLGGRLGELAVEAQKGFEIRESQGGEAA